MRTRCIPSAQRTEGRLWRCVRRRFWREIERVSRHSLDPLTWVLCLIIGSLFITAAIASFFGSKQ